MRRERDSLGAKAVPTRALYGIFTQRARETFSLTGRPPHPALIRAYARVKKAAARANAALGLLPWAWALVADNRALAFEVLTRSVQLLRTRCIDGLRVNRGPEDRRRPPPAAASRAGLPASA